MHLSVLKDTQKIKKNNAALKMEDSFKVCVFKYCVILL